MLRCRGKFADLPLTVLCEAGIVDSFWRLFIMFCNMLKGRTGTQSMKSPNEDGQNYAIFIYLGEASAFRIILPI